MTRPEPPSSDDPPAELDPAFARAVRAALLEPVEPGLALRLALRVRDQVAAEERARRGPALRPGRARLRFVLGALALHVGLLGWVVLRTPAPVPVERPPTATGFLPPEERAPYERHERPGAETLLPLLPVVPSGDLSDELLARHRLPELDGELPLPQALEVRVAEHPPAVGFEMLARLRPGVKAGRLRRAGLEPESALGTVERVLGTLAASQAADGSFPAGDPAAASGGGLPLAARTALALLPFLGEGRASVGARGGAGDAVVARGVAWLRAWIGGEPAAGPEALALPLLALSEDYMLSYGRLTPAEARGRAEEIQALTERLSALQQADGAFGSGGDEARALWPLLALDAAAHTGVVSRSAEAVARLERWFERLPRASSGVPAASGGEADLLLTAGELLLTRAAGPAAGGAQALPVGASVLLARGPEIERRPLTAVVAGLALYRRDARAFRAFNRQQGAFVRGRLEGAGAPSSPAETALLALSLQAAYRTY